MKHTFNPLASALAALQLFTVFTHAAIPLAWDARPGEPNPVAFDRYHGETLALSCTFHGFSPAGRTVFGQDADIRLWYQTNGMGQAWWSAPATVASNVLTAVWSPEMDPGAERVSLFFGAPSNAYAAAVLRLRHSPGFAPANPPPPPSFAEADPLFVAWLPGFAPATNDAVQAAIRAVDELAADLDRGDRIVHHAYNAGYANNADNAFMLYLGNRLVGADDLIAESTNAAVAVAGAATNALAASTAAALAWRVVEIDTWLNDLRFVTNGMIKAEVVGAYIGASTDGWPEGAAMFVRATLAEPIGSQSENIRLVGRDSWPTNNFQSVWWRSGTNVWVSVLVEE